MRPDPAGVDERIVHLLRQHPRGLSITEVAKGLRVSRNVAAKYLETMVVTGKAEMRRSGTSKLFFPSKRVGRSSSLDWFDDPVFVMDEKLRIVQANEAARSFTGRSRDDLIGEDIRQTLAACAGPGRDPAIVPVTETDEVASVGWSIPGRGHFRLRLVPTLTGDRRRGTAVIITDITREKDREEGLSFLSRAPAALVDQETADGVYQELADGLFPFVTGCRLVWAAAIEPGSGLLTVRGIRGSREVIERLTEVFGRDPLGFSLPGELVRSDPVANLHFHQGVLVEGPPVSTMFFGFYPERTCRRIGAILGPGKTYFIGICHGEELFGSIGITMEEDAEVTNKDAIESYISVASAVLHRAAMESAREEEDKDIRFLERAALALAACETGEGFFGTATGLLRRHIPGCSAVWFSVMDFVNNSIHVRSVSADEDRLDEVRSILGPPVPGLVIPIRGNVPNPCPGFIFPHGLLIEAPSWFDIFSGVYPPDVAAKIGDIFPGRVYGSGLYHGGSMTGLLGLVMEREPGPAEKELVEAYAHHVEALLALRTGNGERGVSGAVPGAVIDKFHDGIVMLAENGTITRADGRAVRLLDPTGRGESSSVIGRPIHDLFREIAPGSGDTADTRDTRCYETASGTRISLRQYADDSSSGAIVAIDEIQPASSRGNDESPLMKMTFSMAFDAVMIADPKSRITYVNQAFLDLWGYGCPDEITGKPLRQFGYDIDAADSLRAALHDVFIHNEWRGLLPADGRTGRTTPIRYSATLVKDARDKPLHIVFFFDRQKELVSGPFVPGSS